MITVCKKLQLQKKSHHILQKPSHMLTAVVAEFKLIHGAALQHSHSTLIWKLVLLHACKWSAAGMQHTQNSLGFSSTTFSCGLWLQISKSHSDLNTYLKYPKHVTGILLRIIKQKTVRQQSKLRVGRGLGVLQICICTIQIHPQL